MKLYKFLTLPPAPAVEDKPILAEEIPHASVVAASESEARRIVADRLQIQFGMQLVEVVDAPAEREPGVVIIHTVMGTDIEAPELPPRPAPTEIAPR